MSGMGSQPRLLALHRRQQGLDRQLPIATQSPIPANLLAQTDSTGSGALLFVMPVAHTFIWRSESLNHVRTVAENTPAYILIERRGLDTRGLNTGIIGTSQLK
jgi:hypothetical protein